MRNTAVNNDIIGKDESWEDYQARRQAEKKRVREIKRIEKAAVAKIRATGKARVAELKAKRAEAIAESKKAPRGTVAQVRCDLVWPIEHEMDRVNYKYYSAERKINYWAAKQIRGLDWRQLNKAHKSAIKTYE